MIARIRGDHDTRWGRWRPTAARNGRSEAVPATDVAQRRVRAASKRRSVWAVVTLGATAAVLGIALAEWLPRGSTAPELPATPRAWLDQYEAAAIDNPSRVCSALFSPELARAYGRALHSGCSTYFERITSFSVVVRRVLVDGSTAVLELQQTVRPRDWAVVLSRRSGGWQAVDLLAGSLVR